MSTTQNHYRSHFTGKEIEERLAKVDFFVDKKVDIIHNYAESISTDKIPSMAALNTLNLYLSDQIDTITGSSETAIKFTTAYEEQLQRSTGHFRGVFTTNTDRDAAHPDTAILLPQDECVVLDSGGNTVRQRWNGSLWVEYDIKPPELANVPVSTGTPSDIFVFDTRLKKSGKVIIQVRDAVTNDTHVCEILLIGNSADGIVSTEVKSIVYAEVYTGADLITSITSDVAANFAVVNVTSAVIGTITISVVSLM